MKDTDVHVVDAQVFRHDGDLDGSDQREFIMKGIDLFKNAQSKLECSDAPVARFYSARCLVIDKEKIGPPRSNFLIE